MFLKNYLVVDSWINGLVVQIDTGLAGHKVHFFDSLLTEQNREVLRVGDVLEDGNNDSSGLLEDILVRPGRVQRGENARYTVVFTNKQRLQGHNTRILIHTIITFFFKQ